MPSASSDVCSSPFVADSLIHFCSIRAVFHHLEPLIGPRERKPVSRRAIGAGHARDDDFQILCYSVLSHIGPACGSGFTLKKPLFVKRRRGCNPLRAGGIGRKNRDFKWRNSEFIRRTREFIRREQGNKRRLKDRTNYARCGCTAVVARTSDWPIGSQRPQRPYIYIANRCMWSKWLARQQKGLPK